MATIIRQGMRLPDTTMAELVDGVPVGRSTREIFSGKRAILIGVPAAFSPICSRVHVRGFVEQAKSLFLSGFDMIACVSANDPWVLANWAQAVDPNGRLRFLSDGNLEFAQACSLTTTGHDIFVGTRLSVHPRSSEPFSAAYGRAPRLTAASWFQLPGWNRAHRSKPHPAPSS